MITAKNFKIVGMYAHNTYLEKYSMTGDNWTDITYYKGYKLNRINTKWKRFWCPIGLEDLFDSKYSNITLKLQLDLNKSTEFKSLTTEQQEQARLKILDTIKNAWQVNIENIHIYVD